MTKTAKHSTLTEKRVFLAVLLSVVLGINSSSSQELTRYYYPDGTVSSEGYLVNGQPDGYWKSYYPNGTLKSVGKRTNFQLDSVWCFFDEQGNLQKEISYLDNHKNGFYKEYTSDSSSFLSISVLYVNDQKQGNEQYFSKNGELIKDIPFVNNKKEGKGYEYTDGIVTTILIFENDRLISSQSINRTDSLGLKTGQHVSFYSNGAMKSEAYYDKGKLNGKYRLYNQHEQLIQVGDYQNDSLVYSSSTMDEFEDPFEKKEYYPDSTLKFKGGYRDKTPIGIHRHYDKNGSIVDGELYDTQGKLVGQGITLENGDKTGKWIFFYPSGKIESEGMYSQGQKSGVWKFFYPDETIKQQGAFSNGLYSGTWEFYNESGDVIKREEYEIGQRNGLSIEYDEEGNVVSEGMYKDDRQQGIWKITVGDLVSEGNYEYGEKFGVWKSSYLNGHKAFKGEYFSGKPNGKHYYYYQNGQVEHNEQWKHGKAVKTWNYYNENGNLKYSVYYKDGQENRIVAPSK